MSFDPNDDPFKIRMPSALKDLFRRGIGVRRSRPAAKPGADSGPSAEPEHVPIQEAEPAEPPKAKVVLRNPRWEVEDVGFNEETEISIEADLPAEHAHKTRVAFELFAVTPDGPESVSKAEGQIKDGKATARIPVYIPEYKDEDFNLLRRVDYYFTAKHSESDLFKDEKAVKTVDHLAAKLLEVHVLDAVTFATDKSFLRTSQAARLKALGQAVTDWRGRHPDGKLAVFGHADAVGQEEHNKKLSERRARAVHAYLAKDPKPWAELHDEEKWGLATTQELLKHLGHDPGAIDGLDGPKTQAAVKDFQEKKGLGATGAADSATREALYLAYMEASGSPRGQGQGLRRRGRPSLRRLQRVQLRGEHPGCERGQPPRRGASAQVEQEFPRVLSVQARGRGALPEAGGARRGAQDGGFQVPVLRPAGGGEEERGRKRRRREGRCGQGFRPLRRQGNQALREHHGGRTGDELRLGSPSGGGCQKGLLEGGRRQG